MASVSQLGYLGLGVSDIAEWERFATEILGMQISERSRDGRLKLRIDHHHFRFALYPGRNDDLAYIGWEAPDRSTFDAVCKQLDAARIELVAGSPADATARGVAGMVRFREPNGVPTEIIYGPLVHDDPFVSPRPISGFRAGELGAGHFMLAVDDLDASLDFYKTVLGMRVSDFVTLNGPSAGAQRVAFLRCSPRHHTLAIMAVPGSKKRLNHFMIELNSLDDVGETYELCQDRKLPIIAGLGRHTNDRTVSFYMRSPSGFAVEYGWGGRTVDDATWQVQTHTSGSLWGHRGLMSAPEK